MTAQQHPSSYRDPGGYLFTVDHTLYRAVLPPSEEDYAAFRRSGLQERLVADGLLVEHSEVAPPHGTPPDVRVVLKPRLIPFVSYPYEWCFSALKEAALLTLRIARAALAHDFMLKDGSAFNVLLDGPRPVFIDTLSFTRYTPGQPWIGYRQFCEQFVAPLALASTVDVRLLQLGRVHLDGIPLQLAVRLLPRRSLFRLGLLLHLHTHARSQRRHERGGERPTGRLSKSGLDRLLGNLEETVAGLRWDPPAGTWTTYYGTTNYPDAAFAAKLRAVERFLDDVGGKSLWDLGANTGAFSQPAVARGMLAVAMDDDPGAVEVGYRQAREQHWRTFLPLVIDLRNPSPGLGWAERERASLLMRGPADAVLALALVHHLAISGNLPLRHIVEFLAAAGRNVLVEFVPKSDSRVQHLLRSREDIFLDYSEAGLVAALAPYFTTRWRQALPGSSRVLYALTRRSAS